MNESALDSLLSTLTILPALRSLSLTFLALFALSGHELGAISPEVDGSTETYAARCDGLHIAAGRVRSLQLIELGSINPTSLLSDHFPHLTQLHLVSSPNAGTISLRRVHVMEFLEVFPAL